MAEGSWDDVVAALARAGSDRPVRFWLRDDDAADATPALRRLAAACGSAGMPVLLAVIPAGATPALADWLADHSQVTPCQHGLSHVNHAVHGERACELGGDRTDEQVFDDLRTGRERLLARLRSDLLSAILVPPWNRIRETLIPGLPALGYAALSTFGGAAPPGPLPRLDCDLDIIDWRNGRRGRSPADLCNRLVRLIEAAAFDDRPIGLLTHHLAHDEAAWSFLERALPALGADPRARFTSASEELARSADGRDQTSRRPSS